MKVKSCSSSPRCRKQKCPLQQRGSLRDREDAFVQEQHGDLQHSAKEVIF